MGQIIALFYHTKDAGEAVDELIEAGIPRDAISLLATEEKSGHFRIAIGSKAAEGVAAGGTLGAVLGFGATLTATGPVGAGVLAVGPILVALAGLGVGASVGGIIGALVGMGITEHQAKFYEREIRESAAVLVGVATAGQDDAIVAALLHRHKAAHIAAPALC